EGMCEDGGLGPCREPLILLLNNRALAVAGQESAIACHDLSDEWLAHWILLYKARDRRHAASLRQRQKTRDLRPVQPQNGLWPPSWLDVARDAHLREKDDVCSPVGSCAQVGCHRRQILLNGAFLAAHLHQAHTQPAHGASPR